MIIFPKVNCFAIKINTDSSKLFEQIGEIRSIGFVCDSGANNNNKNNIDDATEKKNTASQYILTLNASYQRISTRANWLLLLILVCLTNVLLITRQY